MFLSIPLLLVYLLPYSAPCSLADWISNGSSIINGSISDIPSDVPPITLFIVNNNNPDQFIPVPGISSSNNVFSIEMSANEGDVIGFKINGKDTGTTIVFYPGTTLEVQLHYTPPGSVDVTVVPISPTPTASVPTVTATPIPDNVTATPTATPTPLPTLDLTNTATPSPISISPAATATNPSTTATSVVYPIIYVIIIGITLLAMLIICLRRL